MSFIASIRPVSVDVVAWSMLDMLVTTTKWTFKLSG
jgi:hypothetical protein